MTDSKTDSYDEKLKQKCTIEEYQRIKTSYSHGARRIAGTSSPFDQYEECWCSDCLYALQREPTL